MKVLGGIQICSSLTFSCAGFKTYRLDLAEASHSTSTYKTMFPVYSQAPIHDGEKYHLSSAQRRFLYKATRHEFRTDRGTPYPCSQDDLDGYVKFKHSNEQAQYITPNSATNELTRWLSEHPDPDADAALHRLRAGLKLMPWEPDIIIKAFRDLDISFFKGTLSGNVTVRWKGNFNWVRRYGFEPAYGLTDKQGHAQCHIALCAHKIFLDEKTILPYREMWRTLLHEMVVSWFDPILLIGLPGRRS